MFEINLSMMIYFKFNWVGKTTCPSTRYPVHPVPSPIYQSSVNITPPFKPCPLGSSVNNPYQDPSDVSTQCNVFPSGTILSTPTRFSPEPKNYYKFTLHFSLNYSMCIPVFFRDAFNFSFINENNDGFASILKSHDATSLLMDLCSKLASGILYCTFTQIFPIHSDFS